MNTNDFYLNRFFDWVGDAGCLFPFLKTQENGSLQLVDIESMKLALEVLFYDEKHKIYATKVNEFAQKEGFIHDPMEIIPFEKDKLAVYEWIEEDEDGDDFHIPEPRCFMTLEQFIVKYPDAIKLHKS